jgi:NADH-quinone oxidoreductase subunit I
MYGSGIIKGMGVTLKHFFESFIEDFRYLGKGGRYSDQFMSVRQGPKTTGIFTVQYPEEKLPVPENFRYIPFLVFDTQKNEDKCTSCGICAKVCPPQCIWIVRSNDPNTGRPIPEPTEFYIDVDICMNCGFCAEYCPFDAIIMDHDFELASYGRSVYGMEKLLKPASYYKSIRPEQYDRNEAERQAKEAAKAAKAAAKPAAPAATP